ncbi:hypothetical protein BDZ89DRAFT_887255, partial [Hymenopellis radicata]
MALPANIPTLQALASGNYTRVDNVFISEHLLMTVIQCTTEPERRPVKTDHLPIVLTLDLNIEQADESPRRNFRTVDWAKFRKTLGDRLDTLPSPRELQTKEALYAALENLNRAIDETVQDHVPMTTPCPHSKRWFNTELRDLRKTMKRAARKSFRFRAVPDHAIHVQFKEIRKQY